jgi:hypothetical protein
MFQRYPAVPRAGMPVDIIQRFLDDAKDRGFHIKVHPGKFKWFDLERRRDPTALAEPFKEPTDGRG